MSMVIQFNEIEEFITELKREFGAEAVDDIKKQHPNAVGFKWRSVVRITGMRKQTLGPTSRLKLVVTVKNRDNDLVRLEKEEGELWGIPSDNTLIDNFDKDKEKVSEAAKGLGLEVRAGVFKLAESEAHV